MVQIGLNKALFEKRLELNLSRKEAAKLLGISKFKLTIIERGYIRVSKKNEARFISTYHLEENFFSDYYKYPIIINEKLYEPISETTFLDKLGSSKKVKIISGILALGFTAMCIAGFCSVPKLNGTTGSYYSNEVKAVHSYVIKNGIDGIAIPQDSDFAPFVPDRYYYLEKEFKSEIKETFSINFFEKEANLPYAWTTGKYKITDPDGTYSVKFQSRFIGSNSVRVHFIVKDYFLVIPYPLNYITCDVKIIDADHFEYNFLSVVKYNQLKGNVVLHEGDPYYEEYTEYFKQLLPQYCLDIKNVFNSNIPTIIGTPLTFETFVKGMITSTTNYYGQTSLGFGLGIAGFIFAILAIGVLVLGFMFKNNADKRLLKFVEQKEEQDAIPVLAEPTEQGKKTLQRNKWIDMVVPEFGVRTISLILLFVSSIATYVVFVNAITINVQGIVTSLGLKTLLTNLSVLAVMMLYFVKLDIYQNKKSAFATNMFLFILGLLYYLALLLVYYGLIGVNDTIGTITDTLFMLLPGNIVWAVLVFNMIIIFMFAPVKDKYKDKPHAELKLRLLTLIPFAYLVASCIVTGGLASGWKMPYAVSSLFFSKAPMITVFAIVYCVAVFIYRRYTKKKYGEVNGLIYQNGNKYNFIRNITAAATVAAIGIFDLLCYFLWRNNPMGFGTNWLMLFAVPVILFYHPHIGKRNGLWDTIYLILYGLAYIIGIVLIVFAVLSILTKL